MEAKKIQMTIYLDADVRMKLEDIQVNTYLKTRVFKSFNEIINEMIQNELENE